MWRMISFQHRPTDRSHQEMPSEKSVSFRSHLVSNAVDLIQEVGLECTRTAKLIAAIVSQLAAYTEEGVPIAPSVFICNSIASLLQRAGVGEFIPLSGDVPLEHAGPQILKAAASLCGENWRIYVERSADGQTCRFGVFCGSSDPSSLTVNEVLSDGFEEGFPVIRIEQSGVNKVEVRTNSGSGIEFRFNDDVDVTELKGAEQITQLANTICAGVDAPNGPFASFVTRMLSSSIKNSHGTLIAVIRAGELVLPATLKDSVQLTSPIHLFDRFRHHVDEGKTAVSVSRLQTATELISGLISSDGITVFNGSGSVVGYRAFVHNEGGVSPSSGGARSRAFSAMCGLLNTDLVAAFFRSQDGRTDFRQRAQEV